MNDEIKEAFFQDGRFVPERLGQEIIHAQKIITIKDNKQMYWYGDKEGIWKENAEIEIQELTMKILGELYKRNYVEETIHYIQARTFRTRDIFDVPVHFIPLSNGVLDIRDMSLHPYDNAIFFLTKLPIEFNPEAECPKIDEFFSQIVSEEDKPLLYQIAGWCLYRDYHIQKAILLEGEGANGKSTYLKLVEKILGRDNITSMSLQEIETNRFAKSNLYHKLANVHADLSTKALHSTGTFKMLTGGDLIFADKKFKSPFQFTNYAKLVFSANKMPTVKDDTDAFFRRWVIIRFPNKFEGKDRDPNLIQKITTKEELQGFLRKSIEALKELLERGEFTDGKTTDELREYYIRLSDSVGAFFMDMLEFSPDGEIPKDELYDAYVRYCRDSNLTIEAKNQFPQKLATHIQVKDSRKSIQGKQVRCWKGVSFKENNENSQPSQVRQVISFLNHPEESIQGNKVRKNPTYLTNPTNKQISEAILRIISDFEKENKEPIEIEHLLSLYDEKDQPIVEECLTKMKDEGVIFEPVSMKVKVV